MPGIALKAEDTPQAVTSRFSAWMPIRATAASIDDIERWPPKNEEFAVRSTLALRTGSCDSDLPIVRASTSGSNAHRREQALHDARNHRQLDLAGGDVVDEIWATDDGRFVHDSGSLQRRENICRRVGFDHVGSGLQQSSEQAEVLTIRRPPDRRSIPRFAPFSALRASVSPKPA